MAEEAKGNGQTGVPPAAPGRPNLTVFFPPPGAIPVSETRISPTMVAAKPGQSLAHCAPWASPS